MLAGEKIELKNLGEEHVGKTVQFTASLQNARKQGAKMCFTELRASRDWSVQALVVEGEGVSRQMVKWTTGLSVEGFVNVEVGFALFFGIVHVVELG